MNVRTFLIGCFFLGSAMMTACDLAPSDPKHQTPDVIEENADQDRCTAKDSCGGSCSTDKAPSTATHTSCSGGGTSHTVCIAWDANGNEIYRDESSCGSTTP